MTKVIHESEPTCFEEAIRKTSWDSAMDEEMAALDANHTWKLVALPHHKKAIGCKWLYKIKQNVDGSISIYKTKLVAKGYAQTYGIDYEETFSLVSRMETMKAMATRKGWSLHQMDVINAFLHGNLQDEGYIT